MDLVRQKRVSEGKKLGLLVVLLATFIAGFIILYQTILVSVAVGLVIAYLLYPFVEWSIEKTGRSRRLIVILTILSSILLLSLIFVFGVPPIYEQVGQLVDLAPSAYHKFLRTWLPILKNFLVDYRVMSSEQFDSIYQNLTVGTKFFDAVRNTVETVWRTAPKIFGTIVGIFLVPMVSYLILEKFNTIREYFYRLVPRSALRATNDILFNMNLTLRGVIKGQVYVAMTLGCLYVIGFSAVGLQAGAAIGIVCGVARLVPYLDILMAAFLSFIVIVSSFSGWPVVIGVGLVILIVQVLDGTYITPRLVGGSAGLHPVVVICSIIAFSGLFGFWGVLVAIPTIALMKQAVMICHQYYIATDFYKK